MSQESLYPGWTKDLVRHKETLQGNVRNCVSEKNTHGRGGNRESQVRRSIQKQKKPMASVNLAKCKAEREKFGNAMQRDDQKNDAFKTVGWMVKLYSVECREDGQIYSGYYC